MPSAKSALFLLGAAALAANVAVGCSSSTGQAGFEEGEDSGPGASLPESGTLGPTGDSSTPPTRTDSGMLPGADASSTDSGGDASLDSSSPDADAAVEAGPDASADAGAPGSPCLTANAIEQQACGLCGTQSRLCAPKTSAAGAPLVWQPWGFCQDEVAGGCVPGTATTETCGLCGTRNKVCQNDCRYAVGACKNEPVGACSPGTVDFELGLSCATGGRSRTCGATCTFGAFGACFVQGDPTLTLTATAGTKVSGQFTLPAASTAPRLSGTCPVSSFSTATPYTHVVLSNPTAKTVVVSVWTSQSSNAGSAYIDTVIASYDRATKPVTDPERKACVEGVNDTCGDASDPTACVSSWGGLFDTDAVTIAPGAKAVIYVAAYFASDHGDFQLTARTDSSH